MHSRSKELIWACQCRWHARYAPDETRCRLCICRIYSRKSLHPCTGDHSCSPTPPAAAAPGPVLPATGTRHQRQSHSRTPRGHGASCHRHWRPPRSCCWHLHEQPPSPCTPSPSRPCTEHHRPELGCVRTPYLAALPCGRQALWAVRAGAAVGHLSSVLRWAKMAARSSGGSA